MMVRTAVYLSLAFLFLANAVSSESTSEAAPSVSEVSGGDGSILRDSGDILFDVRSNITLRCDAAAGGGAVAWQKNGTALEEVWEMKDRYTLERGGIELHVKRAAEDDFGNYSCSLPGQSPATTWVVRARPHLKLPANSNVVEGQKLKLTCKVLGKPYPRIVWSYSNSTEEGARFEPVTGVNLSDSEQGVVDGTLVLPDATRSHAGRYRCEALDAFAPAETLLRVKDKYAALWPFLGICAEVFVLCAIILVYEKRRTKPDLDDSDTDNHDQKKS
ncbi:basigin isoform X2 [Pieris brassicae]|nr:basigin isoform X2 [Pieris brassicae]